ncbi:hypothetical protein [Pseudomonas sp. CCOS 191]|uniref:hypothetical protein n=1 Tax=Pseudomonas sp. CCOS 191 TaxID=1649877 RepID=UPI0018E6A962|nr:hypothetical protein [Pseudomonas sp. CCOS 191]MBI6955951.1 hypothetical protein [Pseudomonas sp. CCOS 191]
MSDNLYILRKWLALKTRVSPGDVVVALHGAKVNHLLEQEYVRRFSNGSYFEPFSAAVVENGYLQYYLHDFQLDTPRLTFANEDLDDSLAYLNMVIIGGTKVSLESIIDGYKVTALDAITPLHGPLLSLKLLLDEVDGVIGDKGELLLDLSKSSDFSVDIDEHESLRYLTGALFKTLFDSLPPDHRIFSLGAIKPGEAPAHMRPQAFALRTQRDTEDNGSLLIFISMKEGFKGKPPSTGNDFKYLHPIDRPQSTATLLLGIRRTVLLALYPKWLEQFGQTPVVEYESERLGRIKLKGIESQEPRTSKFISHHLSFEIALAINNDPSKRRADNFNFILELNETKGSLTWDAIEILVVIDELSARRGGHAGSPSATKREVLTMRYTTDYTVEDDPPVKVVRQPGKLEPQDLERWRESLNEYFYALYYYDDVGTAAERALQMVGRCSAEVESFANRAVSGLDEMVAIDQEAEVLLDQLLALGFDELIVGGETYGPCDVARFAQIAVHKDAPTLTPQGLIVGSGQGREMKAAGSSPVKRWEVEGLGTDALGTIDQNGTYRAPAANLFPGNLLRERVKVTTESGAYSYALVTVTKSNLLVSPLVRVCVAGKEVQLVASSTLEDPSVLQWSLEGELKGKLSATTGRAVGYIPPKEDRGKSYVIDEIVVTDPAAPTTDTFRVYMITPMISKPTDILVTDVTDTSACLRPLTVVDPSEDEVTWKVSIGPEGIEPVAGAQNGEAVYTPPSETTDRFALIEVEIKKPLPLGPKRGFVILPLPLHEYTLPDQRSWLKQIQRWVTCLSLKFRAFLRSI